MREPLKYRPDSIKNHVGRAQWESHKEMLYRHEQEKQDRRQRHHERRSVRSTPPICLL